MISDKFLYEFFDLGIVIVECAAFLGSEYYIFDSLYLCRRSCKTYLLRVGVNVSGAPLLKV